MVHGIQRVGKSSQQEFLSNLGIEGFLSEISDLSSRRDVSISDSEEDLAGIGSLIDPDGLGRFRVGVHSKGLEVDGAPPSKLTGVNGGSPLAKGHRAPTLNSTDTDHARLLRASNPFSQAQPPPDTMPTWEELFSDEP